MQLIKPSVRFENQVRSEDEILKFIERVGRTCYKSENKITNNSAKLFVKNIIKNKHYSVLEHVSFTVRIICDRGVSHELVRHRIASYSQESTRYCNYTGGMDFIVPRCFSFLDDFWIHTADEADKLYYSTIYIDDDKEICFLGDVCRENREQEYNTYIEKKNEVSRFIKFLAESEKIYNYLIEYGYKPQEARAVLPNALKTEVVMTANIREWFHFFDLRTSAAAHPDMRYIANLILDLFCEKYPTLFLSCDWRNL